MKGFYEIAKLRIEVSNIVEAAQKPLQLGFVNDLIREPIGEINGSTDRSYGSLVDIVTKESDLGLEKIDLSPRNSKTISFDDGNESVDMFVMLI